jgi:uncharacterized protein (AIM24 family)
VQAAKPGGMIPLDTELEHVQQEYTGGRGRISYRIDGTTLQVVTIELEPGEVIYSETVTFASEFPGKIIPFDLKPRESLIVQKDAFMCAEKSVDLDLTHAGLPD